MNPDRAQIRQLSTVSLGGVTLLLVVAFAIRASAGLPESKRSGPTHRADTTRSVIATETTQCVRVHRSQNHKPAATPGAPSAHRPRLVAAAPCAWTAPVAHAEILPPLHETDLPPPHGC